MLLRCGIGRYVSLILYIPCYIVLHLIPVDYILLILVKDMGNFGFNMMTSPPKRHFPHVSDTAPLRARRLAVCQRETRFQAFATVH